MLKFPSFQTFYHVLARCNSTVSKGNRDRKSKGKGKESTKLLGAMVTSKLLKMIYSNRTVNYSNRTSKIIIVLHIRGDEGLWSKAIDW